VLQSADFLISTVGLMRTF